MNRTPLKRKTPLRAKTALRATQGIQSRFKPLRSTTGKKTTKKTHAKKQPSQAKLKKQLDSIFSQYIRRKYADQNGMVHCYTCSTVKHWKEIQNGHWIPRNNLATRFSENNCRPQCVACNMFQHGMPDVFAVNLIKEGVDIVALQQTRYSVFKIDRQWYLEQIEKYTALLEGM